MYYKVLVWHTQQPEKKKMKNKNKIIHSNRAKNGVGSMCSTISSTLHKLCPPGKIDVIAWPWTTLLSDPPCNNHPYHCCFCFDYRILLSNVPHFGFFFRASACCRRDIDTAPPSLCPSNAGFVPKLLQILWNFYTNRRVKLRRREPVEPIGETIFQNMIQAPNLA